MRSLLVYLWIAVAVFSCGSNDVLANKDRKELYAAAFTKMAEEFAAVKDLTDPIEIRRRHAAIVKAYGNFSQDPCHEFMSFAAEGYFSTVPGKNPDVMDTVEYDSEVFKYLSREVLKAGKYEFSCSAERKATKFYSSCMEYEPSSEDLQAVARKLFEIVERSPNLGVANFGLQTYGIDLFWSFSLVKTLYMDKPPEFLSSKTLEELKDTVTTILQINNEADGNVDEIAQRVWEFNEEFKKCGSPGTSGIFDYFSLQQATERYPALHLAEVLKPLYAFKMDFDVRTNDVAYMENLNKLLEKTDLTTIKEYMTVRVYEYLRKTQNSFRNVANTCSDATFEFFEPALKSLFIGTYTTLDDAANVVAVFEAHIEFLRAQFKALGASPKQLQEFETKFGNIAYVIDPIYTDIQYLDSLYADLSYESGKGFLEEYFDTAYNHNKMRMNCMANPKVGDLRVDYEYPDTWKPHQICRTGDRPYSLPLRYLTVPFYHTAYPKYWTHGSLIWPHFYNFLYPRDRGAAYFLNLMVEFYSSDANVAEEYPGYEDLSLTIAQLYQVARMQGASMQGDGWHLFHFGNVNKDPKILKDFKCNL